MDKKIIEAIKKLRGVVLKLFQDNDITRKESEYFNGQLTSMGDKLLEADYAYDAKQKQIRELRAKVSGLIKEKEVDA